MFQIKMKVMTYLNVLTDPAQVGVGLLATSCHSLGVGAVLRVEVLDLTVGEHTVDGTVNLELSAELCEEGKALLLAGKLEQVGAGAHDGSTTSGHLEDLLLLALPSNHMELLNLSLAQQTACNNGRKGKPLFITAIGNIES